MKKMRGINHKTRRIPCKGFVAALLALLLALSGLPGLFPATAAHTAYAAAAPPPANGISPDGLAITAGRMTIGLNSSGVVTGLTDNESQTNYLQTATQRPLICLYLGATRTGQIAVPASMSYDGGGVYTFAFSEGITAEVTAEAKGKYATFELTDLANDSGRDLQYFIWGPVPVNIKHTIADTLGVVYNDEYAVGLMSLNVKTLASIPWEIPEIIPSNNWHALRFGNTRSAAVPIANGGQLRAHAIDWTVDRTQQYSGFSAFDTPASAYGDDGELIGSKIALYGCATDDVLALVGEMEVAEGLPHPTTNGVWTKEPTNLINNSLRSQYLFPVFDAATINTRIDEGRRMGADLLYGHDTFVSYDGDYRLKGFDTYADFKTAIADVAAAKDMLVGTKNRPAFIGRNFPNAIGLENVINNIARRRTTALAAGIAADQLSGEISVADLTDFSGAMDLLVGETEVLTINRSGDSLAITGRGTQGTSAVAHSAGEPVSILTRSSYNPTAYFIGSQPYIKRAAEDMLAGSINAAGMSLSDMDGLEEAMRTGHGWYMTDKTMDMWYNAIDEENRDGVKSAGSGMDQWQWHIFSYQTWGEKYEDPASYGQYSYRIGTNYDYFKRNFFPATLGLLGNTASFTVEKAQFVGAKAAAFNAQITVADEGMPSGLKNAILDTYREWTAARDVNAFTFEQRQKLAPYENRFSLSVVEPGIEWQLNTLASDGSIASSEPAKAPGVENVARGGGVAVSGSAAIENAPEINDKKVAENAIATVGDGPQYIQIDLGQEQPIDQIRVWHDYADGRRYNDVAVQLSSDPDFASGATTVFNNDADNSLGLGAGADKTYSESFVGKTLEFGTVNARYVRLWSNGSDAGAGNHYAEVQVLSGARTFAEDYTRDELLAARYERGNPSLAKNIAPTYSSAVSYSGATANAALTPTDGILDSDYYVGFSGTGLKWMQLDLGKSYLLDRLKVWHYWANGRTYHDVVFQVSNDPAFAEGVTTVFNNDADNSSGLGAGTDAEYAETIDGKEVAFAPVNARYVRFWANGSTTNGSTHYVEVEVYGSETAQPPEPGPGIILDLDMDSLVDGGKVQNSADGALFGVNGAITLADSLDGHGKALAFNAEDTYLDLGTEYLDMLTGDFTVQLWAKRTAIENDAVYFLARQRTGVGSLSDALFTIFTDSRTQYQRLQFRATYGNGSQGTEAFTPPGTNGGLNTGYSLPLNEWHHISMSRSGSAGVIYLDGEPLYTADNLPAGALKPSTLPLLVGAIRNGSNELMWSNAPHALMDDIQIYNKALTQEEVQLSAGLIAAPQPIAATGVALDRGELALTAGGAPVALIATVSPEDADNQAVAWGSSDESVAAVDGDGLVTAVAAGTATITATTDDGGFTASCEVTVSAALPPVDKAGLEALVDEAKAIDLTPYTQASREALADAIAGAERVLADDGATQGDVGGALAALGAAIEGLAQIPPEPGETDKGRLAALAASLARFEAALFDDAAWGALEAARGAAQAVLGDAGATQDQVGAAAAALEAAIGGLAAAGEYEESYGDLIEALLMAARLDESLYTADSWAALDEAVADSWDYLAEVAAQPLSALSGGGADDEAGAGAGTELGTLAYIPEECAALTERVWRAYLSLVYKPTSGPDGREVWSGGAYAEYPQIYLVREYVPAEGAEAKFSVKSGAGIEGVGVISLRLSVRTSDLAGGAAPEFALPQWLEDLGTVGQPEAEADSALDGGAYTTYFVYVRALAGKTFDIAEGQDVLDVAIKAAPNAGPASLDPKPVVLVLSHMNITYTDGSGRHEAVSSIRPSTASAVLLFHTKYDVNQDGRVDLADVDYVRYYLGRTSDDPEWTDGSILSRCDFYELPGSPDGVIDPLTDLLEIKAAYKAATPR